MFMKTDVDIRRDVESELRWDPSIDDTRVGVTVSNGVVTLTGDVRSYSDRLAADDIAKRVSGVRAIANDIQVKIPRSGVRTDTDIAEAAANVLQWNVSLSDTQIKPVIKDGWVTLGGKVNWGYQRITAENAVRHLMGVKGVTNDIRVASNIKVSNVKAKIEDAFKRHAILDAKDIEVNVDDSTIILKGRVHTWQERADASQAAWSAPGVVAVENHLAVL
jgi:osmotically-inducible protein OsmY